MNMIDWSAEPDKGVMPVPAFIMEGDHFISYRDPEQVIFCKIISFEAFLLVSDCEIGIFPAT